MTNSNNILIDFDGKKNLLNEFGDVTFSLIKSLISNILTSHQISFRVKDRDSLSNKLLRKNNKYNNINQITDLVGLRIITYFEDDIDKIAEIFKNEFEIDYPNSIDKRNVDADKFGYRSLHYVASLNKARLNLTEYKKFKGLKFEVQIRSILQHSWAEIEHDLGYKGANEIPKTAKRTFYRVAALLEQADIEFVKLRKEIENHEILIKEQIINSSPNIEIDKAALIAFIKESNALQKLENKLEQVICTRSVNSESSSAVVEAVMERLKKNDINTVKKLEDLIGANESIVIEWARENYESLPEPKPKSFSHGASIIWLLNTIEGKEARSKKKLPIKKK